MLFLCIVLYTIVVSRMESASSIIFGGSDETFVCTDGINYSDLNVTPTRSRRSISGRS